MSPPLFQVLMALVVSVALQASPVVASDGDDRPALTPADYGRWESFGWGAPHALSPDGAWLAYELHRVDGSDELRVQELDGQTRHTSPFGSAPRFNADGTHLLWSVGHSDDERERLEDQGESVRDGAVLLDLASGEQRRFEAIQAAHFDETGRYVALHHHPAPDAEGPGADLILIDLAGDELSFGNVTAFAWSEQGSLLALCLRRQGDGGHGVQLYAPAENSLTALDTSGDHYEGLAWCEDGPHLATYRVPADTDQAPATVIAWRGLGTDQVTRHELDSAADGVPEGLDLVRFGTLRWSPAGRRLAVGLAAVDPDPGEDGVSEDDLPGVQIWHPADVRILPEQQAQQARDAERTRLAVWDLERAEVIPVGTDREATATILEGWRHAIEEVAAPYPWGAMFGRPYHDVWVVDLEDGTRRRVLERVRHSWASAAGRYLLSFDGRHYTSLRLDDGLVTNLTVDLPADFADRQDDHPSDQRPPHGVGGWYADDAAVLLYDRFDVWRVAPDGTDALRLTRGAEQQISHRVWDLDDDEPALPADDPLYLSTWSDLTEQRGFSRVLPGGDQAESLLFVDKMVHTCLTRAEDAEVFVFTSQAIDDSPDFFVAGPALAEPRQVTETNPFQADYAWTHAELIDFDSEAGEPLQAALYYPVNHDPSLAYPMIVWTYERETPWVHIYDVPDEQDYYNFTTWTQRGYFVLLMDIAYRPRDPGVSAIEAVRPAIGQVVERGLVDADRVGLVGHSWGGYQAAYLPTRTRLFAASVAGAPLTDFVSFMGQIHWGPGIAEVDHWETGQARMEVPFWEDPDAHRRNSPLHAVHELETPILLAHGDADSVVEPFQSTIFYNFARRAGKPVYLLTYEGEDHGFRQPANRLDYHRRINEWFDHHLKGEPAADWITQGVPLPALDEEQRRVARDPLPPVGLNHLYVVLDEATYGAIRSSAFVREQLASVDAGLPEFAPTSDDSPALYLRGRQTYLELLGPDNRFDEPVGQVGLALGVDDPERLIAVERAWNEQLGGGVTRQQQTWQAADPPVPWYDALMHPDTLASPDLVLWVSAYRPEFLPWLYPERSALENGVRRADVLAPHHDPERLLDDVRGVTLGLADDLRERLARQLQVLGYERTDGDGVLRLQGPDWQLSLVDEATGGTGLLSLDLSTTRPSEGPSVVPLGPRSLLVFGAQGGATWVFLPADRAAAAR